ncbi:EthD domain-containing protein [Aspergillus mulundensis]|uniref:EthD domain-containing protein n=1 Tax=Aspergillus mulundensis TaxID=1810919 RepID=A0A3D8REN6_9EURO|nr:hypothetical protein DSM5745_07578 [Aspergillus mulundensis]RDW72406.1 hypothetical protein DSM5745_07578 [Aspergillus mulundensis]
MFVTILVQARRQPTITQSAFRTQYESFVSLVRALAGDAFPIVHRRTYIAHSTTLWEPLLGSNPLINSIDYDVLAELTFEDHAAYERFRAKLAEPSVARQMQDCAARFIDTCAIAMAAVGEVKETRRAPEWFRGVGERFLWE